jgi:multimeric flavodoxin WrbA
MGAMKDSKRVIAIVGSYRRGGVVDRVIDEVLESVKEEGMETRKIYLIQQRIEFCTNCRACTQNEGQECGECPIADDMIMILDEVRGSDAIVLGSPMNFGTVTAVMKAFIERLACFAYWPWGAKAPKVRKKVKTKKAVLVASSAAPAVLARLTTRMIGLLKNAAGLLGAETIGVIFVGLAALEESQELPNHIRTKARLFGKKLASPGRG